MATVGDKELKLHMFGQSRDIWLYLPVARREVLVWCGLIDY